MRSCIAFYTLTPVVTCILGAMAEAIAALSLAANVVQFIDFGSKVLATTYRLRRCNMSDGSGSGQLQDLKIITNSLRHLINGFTTSLKLERLTEELSQTEQNLLTLTKHCCDISEELLQAVTKLEGSSKLGTWNSFCLALKSVWAEEKIEVMRQRLDRFRQEIVLHVLACFRYGRPSIKPSELYLTSILGTSSATQ